MNKFVDRAGGRQVYAKGVVQAFAKETGVRPTNVRVSPLRDPGRGMKGILVVTLKSSARSSGWPRSSCARAGSCSP